MTPIPIPLDGSTTWIENRKVELLEAVTRRVVIKGWESRMGIQWPVGIQLGRIGTFWCALSSWVAVDKNYVLHNS